MLRAERPGSRVPAVFLGLALALGFTLAACTADTLRGIALPGSPPSSDGARAGLTAPIVKESKEPPPQSFTPWLPFERDGLHDPASPAFHILQRPTEALAPLPRDSAGNYVRWVKALEDGLIAPRTNIFPETKVNVLDLDVFLSPRGSLPVVRFPHRQHTLWLDCDNCHEQIFKKQAGATVFTMVDILNGRYCGQCHGAVAFPLTECGRCHSVSHEEYQRIIAEKAKAGRLRKE
jgi:c(7)-type cytochrome triheme protein